MKNANLKLIQPRDEIKKDPAKVGQAVFDIMSKPQEMQEVGETLQAMTPRYYEELMSTVKDRQKDLNFPFYVIVLRKKEPWALNVLRQWYIGRQTRPDPRVMRQDYPNHDLDLWLIKTPTDHHLEWVLPTRQDAYTMLKNKHLYHSDIIEWILKFNRNELV